MGSWRVTMNKRAANQMAQLAEQFALSAKLEMKIKKNLAGLGYEF